MPADLAQFSDYAGTWLGILVGFALKGAIIMAVAGLAVLALRRASAAARHLVWNMSLAALLVLPLLSFLMPAWNVAVLPEFDAAASSEAAPVVATPAPIPDTEQLRQSVIAATEKQRLSSVEASPSPITEPEPAPKSDNAIARTESKPLGWQFWALGIWLAGALIVMLRMLLGTVSVWWIIQRASEVEDASWTSLAEFLTLRLELKRPVRLLASSSVSMPITCGLFRSVVLIPQNTDEWPEERRQVVLSHELAHVKRRDCLTQMLAQLACALYWFNPLIWIAARRLRVERELACDDYVLSTGTKASDYASHLLDLARGMRSSHLSSLTAVAIARRSQLEGRLLAILDPGLKRRGLNRAASVVVAVVLTFIVLPLAALRLATRAEASSENVRQSPFSTPSDKSSVNPSGNINHDINTLSDSSSDEKAAKPEDEAEADQDKDSDMDTPENQDQQKKAEMAGAVDGAVADGIAGAITEILTGQDGKETVRQSVIEGLKEALKDNDPQVRKEAMRALGLAGGSEVVGIMIEALKDSNASTRKHAAWALGMRGNQEVVEPLIGALRDENAEVREQAAWALGMKGDSRAIEPLMNALNDSSADVREQAAWALGLKGDNRAVDALMAALKDSDSQVREKAAWALGLKGDRRAVDALTAALSDADPQVREQAAWALGLKGDNRAVEPLMNALNDSNANVREQAAWALGMRGDARAMNALKAALKDSNKNVREQAAWALGILLMRNGSGMNINTSIDIKPVEVNNLKIYSKDRIVNREQIRNVTNQVTSPL